MGDAKHAARRGSGRYARRRENGARGVHGDACLRRLPYATLDRDGAWGFARAPAPIAASLNMSNSLCSRSPVRIERSTLKNFYSPSSEVIYELVAIIF